MKLITFVALITFFIGSCSQSTTPTNIVLQATFTLTDTLGQTVSQFHPGEEFLLSFILTNTSSDTMTYYRGSTAPPVLFQILKDDSVIASSTDGYDFMMVVLRGNLASGKRLQEYWKGPKAAGQKTPFWKVSHADPI